jgi:hypothetical protein
LEVKNRFPFCPGSSEWGMLKAETAGHHVEGIIPTALNIRSDRTLFETAITVPAGSLPGRESLTSPPVPEILTYHGW